MATSARPCHFGSDQTNDNAENIDETGQLTLALHPSRRLVTKLPHSPSEHERRIHKNEGSSKDGTAHRRHKGKVSELPSHRSKGTQKSYGDLVLQSIRSLLIRNLEQIKVSIPSSDEKQRVPIGIQSRGEQMKC